MRESVGGRRRTRVDAGFVEKGEVGVGPGVGSEGVAAGRGQRGIPKGGVKSDKTGRKRKISHDMLFLWE